MLIDDVKGALAALKTEMQEIHLDMDTNYNFILLSSQKIILIERDDGRKKQVMEKKATVSFA